MFPRRALLSILLALLVSLVPASTQTGKAERASLAPPPPEPESNPTAWAGQALRFEHIGVEDGLSQSTVTAILQDRRGFLWFGTEDGLNRYDGYTFTVFKPDPDDPNSISDRWIHALYEGRDGSIWIGTRLGGLNHFDPVSGGFTHYQHNPADPSTISSNKINAIYEDSNGILWVGTESGLDWLDSISGKITHVLSVPEDSTTLSGTHITSIIADLRGNIWVGTADAGLNRYSMRSNTFRRYSFDADLPDRLCSKTIEAIAQDVNGILWLATPNGLTRLNPISGYASCFRNDPALLESLSDDQVETVFIDRLGRLWVGTARGLDFYVSETGTFGHIVSNPAAPDSLSAETVYSIYQDRGGVMWVGTYGGGINKYDQTRERFAYFRNHPDDPASLSENFIFPIHVDSSGRVWAGTYGGGLNRFDPVTGAFTRYLNDSKNPFSLPNNYVWSIFTDSRSTLWVGTGSGMARFDPESSRFLTYSRRSDNAPDQEPGVVFTMAEDSSGVIWLGTRNGIGRFYTGTGIYLPEQFDQPGAPGTGDRVVSMLMEPGDVLWFGTMDRGLYRFNIRTRSLENYRADTDVPGSLSQNTVFAIHRDARGTLWVATGGGGLNRFEPETGTFHTYTEEDGLPSAVIYGILEDANGNLWMSTNYGVSRFNPIALTFRNFTVNDGLASMDFNMSAYARAPNGAMYFGSVKGLNAFYPDSIFENSYVPPIALTSLTREGKPLVEGGLPGLPAEIVLSWPGNSFEFEFTALGFADTVHNQYAYKLEGFDPDWYYLGNKRNGRYTNLPGGEYTLLLKAANSDGVWNEHPLEIPVTVIPPYWETWWFQLSAVLIVAVLALVGYRVRVRQVEGRNRELEALVRTRTIEMEKLFERSKELAVVEERNRLARDLHDSAKQKAFAALAQLGAVNASMNGPRARHHLLEAETLVAEVIQELTFLIQEMYPAALMENGLAATVREYVFEWASRNDIQADMAIDAPHRLELKVEQAVYRVIQESLANVARHSRARHVQVELRYNHEHLDVLIADDGCGFDLDSQATGVGIRSIRGRIQSIGGQVTFESESGCGTRVRLVIPLAPDYLIPKEGENEEVHLHPHR